MTTKISKKQDEATQPKVPPQNDCPNTLPEPIFDHFYPNECFVCKKTKDLRRCRRCQMISYCGETDQADDWTRHKDICKVISGLMKQEGVSHIYENLRGVNQIKWKEARDSMRELVSQKMPRPLLSTEHEMLIFPRVCFVCFEAKQQNLTNCPSCSSVSFCSQHKNTNSHIINCFHLKLCRDLDIEFNETILKEALDIATLVVDRIVFASENQALPKSLKQLIIHYPKPPVKATDNLKIYSSEFLTDPLTVFNALQRLHLSSVLNLVIHVDGFKSYNEYPIFWEIILHLLPKLQFVKIVMLNNKESRKFESKLCSICTNKNKNLELKTLTISYEEYLKGSSFQEPNIFFYHNIDPYEISKLNEKLWKSSLSAWGSLSCPLIFTTTTDALLKELTQIFKSTLSRFTPYYEALNEFASLRPTREYKLGGIFRNNQFMVILKPLHGDENKKTPDLANSIGKKQSNSIQNIVEKKADYIPKKIHKALDSDEVKVANSLESDNKKLPGLVNGDKKNSDSVLNKVEDKSNSDSRLHRWDFFYINYCQVCHINNQVVPCTRCKMIAYCGEKHRKEHWPQHKNLCKIILGMLKETDTTNLFDKLKTNDAKSWTRVKIDLMLKAESKLGRKLLDYERQMFLFPKTCFECHESDSSILRTCDCGVSLCKQHKKNVKHQNLCDTFQEVFKNLLLMQGIKAKPLPTIAEQGSTITAMKTVPVQTKVKYLPNSIKEFIDYCKTFCDQDSEPFPEESHIFSELLSRPLTMLYVIQKLNFTAASSLTIHVIGATNEEFRYVGYWEILLHWLPQLKEIKVAFVGPEINGPFQTAVTPCESCKFVSKKPALVFSRRSRYNEYYESKFFSKPDVIVGYNLDLHESELGISECTWKESILTLKKLEAPFILTAGTEERAKKDHQRFCTLFEKSVSYDFCEVNPFASLIPERDFETEELKYANKYIIIYKGLCESLEKVDTLQTNSTEKIPIPIKSELKTKVVPEEIKKEKKEVEDFAPANEASLGKFADSKIQFDVKAKEEMEIGASGLAALEEKLAAIEIKNKEDKKSVEVFQENLKIEEKKPVFEKVQESTAKSRLESRIPETKEPEEKSRNRELKAKPEKFVAAQIREEKKSLFEVNLKKEEKTTELESEISVKKEPEKKPRNREFKEKSEKLLAAEIRGEKKSLFEVNLSKGEKTEGLKCETSVGKESEDKSRNRDFQAKLESTESKAKSESKPNLTTLGNPRTLHEDLVEENLFLRRENQILKENEELKEENKKLKQENERLRIENNIIKDIRSQINESIKAAMNGVHGCIK